MVDSLFEQVQASKQSSEGDKRLATYETPLVTVDTVIFTVQDNRLKTLLIQRKRAPYQHMWALPGGFIHVGETLEEAIQRRLFEETNVKDIYLEQLGAFGKPDRDPRSRVITVAYYALISYNRLNPVAHENAEDIGWFSVSDLPELAFDHKEIVDRALVRLKERLKDSNIAFQLLPDKFTLTELQRVYELILDKGLDKRNFRKRMLAMDCIEETGEFQRQCNHRPARLYRVKQPGQVQFIK